MGDVLSEVEELERRIRLLRNRERLDPDYSGKLRRAIRELEDELRRLKGGGG
jgi:hypothetical protein